MVFVYTLPVPRNGSSFFFVKYTVGFNMMSVLYLFEPNVISVIKLSCLSPSYFVTVVFLRTCVKLNLLLR